MNIKPARHRDFFAASPAASYVVGQNIVIDGGLHLFLDDIHDLRLSF